MKIGNRYYFDFNATAPITDNVCNWLASSEYPQGNPASIHTTGKQALWEIDQVKEFLHTTFQLPEQQHRIFFHSGASEGITTLLIGFEKKKPIHFFYLTTDHSCVVNIAQTISASGHNVYPISTDQNGNFDEQELIDRIKFCSGSVLLNCTWVNNETGVVIPLKKIVLIKEQTGCTVHIDAVQSTGKIPHWNRLSPELDAYTFSGHKFGALKGSGFSFLSKTYPLTPLIPPSPGRPYRGGTENLLGIMSLKLALEELQRHYSFEEQVRAKNLLEQKLAQLIKDRGEIVAPKGFRNGNTICLILHDTKAQISTLAFSMAGIDVGSGSACSSGSGTPSRVLVSMGYPENKAKNALRFSFSPQFHESEVEEYYQKIESVLVRFL